MIKEVKIIDKGKILRIRDYGQFVRFVANGSEIEANKKALIDWMLEDNLTFNEIVKRRNQRQNNLGKEEGKSKCKKKA